MPREYRAPRETELTTIWRNGDVLRVDIYGRTKVLRDTMPAEQAAAHLSPDCYLSEIRARRARAAALEEVVEL